MLNLKQARSKRHEARRRWRSFKWHEEWVISALSLGQHVLKLAHTCCVRIKSSLDSQGVPTLSTRIVRFIRVESFLMQVVCRGCARTRQAHRKPRPPTTTTQMSKGCPHPPSLSLLITQLSILCIIPTCMKKEIIYSFMFFNHRMYTVVGNYLHD